MLDIVLECKPDETLIKTLGFSKKEITHQPHKGGVFNYLRKNPGAIGIVDEDPGTANPSFFAAFQRNGGEKYGVESFFIPKTGTRLLVIKPRLEEWVLVQAKSVSVNPKDFSFPEKYSLHKIISTRLLKFQDMLTEMLKRDSKGLRHLKELIVNRN